MKSDWNSIIVSQRNEDRASDKNPSDVSVNMLGKMDAVKTGKVFLAPIQMQQNWPFTNHSIHATPLKIINRILCRKERYMIIDRLFYEMHAYADKLNCMCNG